MGLTTDQIIRNFIDPYISNMDYNNFFKAKDFIYLAMPFMMTNYTTNKSYCEYREFITELINKSTGDNCTLVAFMYKIRLLLNLNEGTCSELKLAARNILKMEPKLEPKYENCLRDKVNNIVEHIRSTQRENKLLESAMINIAPIVPYSGTITPMWNEGVSPIIKLEDESVKIAKTHIIFFRNTVNDIKDIESAYEMLDYLYMTYGMYISSNSGISVIEKSGECLDGLLKCGDTTLESLTEAHMKLYFYISHFLFHYKDNWKLKALEDLNIRSNIYLSGKGLFKELFDHMRNTAAYDFQIPANEFWDEMGVNNEEYQKMLDKVNEIEKYHDEHDKDMTFDIQKMISYLHNNVHIETNNYANIEFLERYKDKGVGNISYYEDDIMSVIINNIVHIPFLDLANDYKLRLLCMNANGDIFTKDMKEL